MLRLLFPLLLAVLTSPASAGADWLNLQVPRTLDRGQMEMALEVRQQQNQSWALGHLGVYMTDTDGFIKQQSVIDLEAQLRWQPRAGLTVEMDVPEVLTEFSPYVSGVPYYQLNAPGLRRGDGLGDMRLSARGAFTRVSATVEAGWQLTVIAPTGLGPFDALVPMVATGEGRWQVLPGLVMGAQGSALEAWLQARGRFQAGRLVTAGPDALVAWGPDNNGLGLVPGNAYLEPRAGVDGDLGLAWTWYRDDNARHSVGVEVLWHYLSPLLAEGAEPTLGPETAFAVMPELQARYGHFTALAGWRGSYIWAQQLPNPDWGQLLLNVAYAF